MGRHKVHGSPAERQRAYLQRLRDRKPPAPTAPPTPKKQRPPSRPARLQAIISTVQDLRDEYQQWLDSTPESLQESEQAHRLTETIEQLQAIVDLLSDLSPPRGFGRD
jgi:predicted component of type VI protein secretion system